MGWPIMRRPADTLESQFDEHTAALALAQITSLVALLPCPVWLRHSHRTVSCAAKLISWHYA